jgi:trk system potassium uptake protein TrkA
MYIVIVGGGRVGYYLAKALIEEGHEVLIVEQNHIICETINHEMGSICRRGDGCEVSTLTDAGTARAAMFVAVTGEDQHNLVACQIAKTKFKVPRTIARIKNPKNEVLFKKLGVDVTICSTNVILEHITEEVPTHPLTHLMEIPDNGMEVVELRIPAGSASAGKAVKDLSLPAGSMLSLIIRKDQKPIVPVAATVLLAGDQVIAVTSSASEEALRAALRAK